MLPVFYCEPRLYFNHLYGILGVILEARICQCLLRAEVCNIFAIYFKLQYSVSHNCTKIVLCIWHYGRVVKAVDSNQIRYIYSPLGSQVQILLVSNPELLFLLSSKCSRFTELGRSIKASA